MAWLLKLVLVTTLVIYTVSNGSCLNVNHTDAAQQRLHMVIDIITHNWKNNGWTNMFVVGNFSDSFFNEMRLKSFTFTVIDFMKNHYNIKRTVPYHSNTILINCMNFDQFEKAITNAAKVPYWHPLSNIILYYHITEKREVLAKIFFVFWYYRAINVIIIQYNDSKQLLLVSQFNPFTCDYVKIQNRFGCWTARKLGLSIDNFEKSIICEEGCDNVPLESKRRFNNLGSCLGFDTYEIPYCNISVLLNMTLFKDKSKNLHGCALRAFAVEVLPFLEIKEHENNSVTLHARDGILWNTVAERMNFTIDLSLGKGIMKQQFNFEVNIQQVYAFTQRKVDLLIYPLYQFDLIIAEVDYTIAYKESGVCFVSHRAEFETIIFDVKFLQKNISSFIKFIICFFCTWFVFSIFNSEQLGRCSFDQLGKDFLNTFRTMLSVSLDKYPKRRSFRIFLTIAIWSFFVINFSTQAAIISIFSAHKRGKEVDTIEDVLERGYPIEGVASPDIVLSEDEERFRIINSRRVSIQDLFGCVNAMKNDSHRFCTVDCAVARYLERNRLNSKGHQYLHVATRDRLHSHYLNMILHRHSPLTANYNKIVLALVEAGLIKKWEEYRFNDIKAEAPIKALAMEDVIGIFECYGILAGMSLFIFFIEIVIGTYVWVKKYGIAIIRDWTALFIKKIKKQKSKRQNLSDASTQTV